MLEALQARGEPYIPAFWHGRMIFLTKVFNRFPDACVLISNHRDGELIARVLQRMGIAAIRGSAARPGKTDKGGMAAFREMLRRLKTKGAVVGITPDGPRGPAHARGARRHQARGEIESPHHRLHLVRQPLHRLQILGSLDAALALLPRGGDGKRAHPDFRLP